MRSLRFLGVLCGSKLLTAKYAKKGRKERKANPQEGVTERCSLSMIQSPDDSVIQFLKFF
ncbi:MAG: hypothetical protein DMG95_06165 [Acidobacteria bacterium]|nr:MAG: hypothetical protein DMG95_06165 [Acidobacteriota bacterium]